MGSKPQAHPDLSGERACKSVGQAGSGVSGSGFRVEGLRAV